MSKTRETLAERWARWISYVLDPFVVLGLLSLWFFVAVELHGDGWLQYLGIFLIDTVPVAIVFGHIMQKQHFRDWDIHRRAWRLPILSTWWVSQAVGLYIAQGQGLERELPFLGIFWLVTTAYMVVTMKWKVSVHTGVLATLASLGLLLGGWTYSWLWLLVVLVAWARVVRHDHTWPQVMMGSLLPPFVVMVGVVLFT